MILPDFSGDETMNPYLQFPIWKNHWDTLIEDHDEKFHASFLLNHLDSAAKEKVVGFESDYAGAMKKLEGYYGNPRKVVACVVSEVMKFKTIRDGDYNSLVTYSNILQNNYTRLKNPRLEHEISVD